VIDAFPPLRLTLPLMRQSADGASDADAGCSKRFWASSGTERGPKITVPLLRWRQSHGAMNAPLHKPCCAFRAWASSSTYALEYLTKANA
jgi:hypothetical protein